VVGGGGLEVERWLSLCQGSTRVQVVMNWKTFTGVDAAEKLWFDRGKRKKPSANLAETRPLLVAWKNEKVSVIIMARLEFS